MIVMNDTTQELVIFSCPTIEGHWGSVEPILEDIETEIFLYDQITTLHKNILYKEYIEKIARAPPRMRR